MQGAAMRQASADQGRVAQAAERAGSVSRAEHRQRCAVLLRFGNRQAQGLVGEAPDELATPCFDWRPTRRPPWEASSPSILSFCSASRSSLFINDTFMRRA